MLSIDQRVQTGFSYDTANATERAVHALWHFLQTGLLEFMHSQPDDHRASLWTESYEGHDRAAFLRFLQEQNARMRGAFLEIADGLY
ncbi:2b540965-6d4c-4f5c-93e2-550e8974ea11 [Thermothielavioides terrestris]|uniref:2b540965-6d4c-4f5c-93e2-550e8974ea11 n=1 Tax=Thermothielavioides terrestris TaxID=2587410 RepID=A0A3S4BNB2_9PEZI|nr:2b540965-6d4c-4f5c-93e2-550e8974ea11 [Thermothielavioides terrestris]